MVGLGSAAAPHLQSLYALREQIDFRHVVTRNTVSGDSAALLKPFANKDLAHTHLERALQDPLVHAVVIITPAASHLSIAQRCFAAGKAVLVEKPLDITLENATAMVLAAQNAQLPLGVMLQHRFRPGSMKLRMLLQAGDLGVIQGASVRVPWWRPQSYYNELGRGTQARDGGGVLLTQAIHSIDLFRSLVGVRRVIASRVRQTQTHQMETEDHVSAIFELDNGATGDLMATTSMYPGFPETIEIIGSLGTAVLTGGDLQVHYMNGESLHVAMQGGSGSGAHLMDFSHDAHQALIEDFVESIQTGKSPHSSGEESLKTQTLIEEVLQRSSP